MPDYGRPIEFGSFITPSALDPERTVALALASEAAGLEFATFQDHPYQPRFLDTWTLMSWVGARTNRIRVSANVHNLLLRPPAVLARAAASLDLLTGGRVVLALGAGGFPQAAEAMGAPVRPPAESGAALAEAVTAIRELLDTDAAGGVFLDQPHYPIRGAKRGPASVQRPIPIWLGVLKPKGLRLVGRAADGWLPSLGRLEHGTASLDAGHAVIDAAARSAGRAPRDIRRLLNVGPDQARPDVLADLATRHGVDTFIVAGDDEALVAELGARIIPEARALVADRRTAAPLVG
ncbi:LLM class flavin-dependent oxidoreductase [Agromyces aurantiacus]|uniref:LLM class flavin-dependent oxidoreductase n=1 Tax=Agromyces aurantiacus TaxID=165814 RepID=A0ABV9R2U1_9MICO|nr:LLM class flavin-dependent oxidoreductase [Agromyces aurantiacus]MBM7502582.1 alkanesulfonate monooxygenase SsuD/methylene tetrahydromethanopterin reductase-like flavin-dependent oxidoreductase (luciferase family) [Agromyces aurantiacus]